MSLFPRWLQTGFDATALPLARGLNAAGVSPNAITTLGAALLLGAGTAFAVGWVRTGGALVLLSGLCDGLDGRMARVAGRMSPFGAFYDSTLDRIGESGLFLGITLWFVRGGVPAAWMLAAAAAAIVALAASLIVSYVRARAEGLNLECKVGMVQRGERIVGLGVPTLLAGAGPDGLLLFAIVALLAVLSVATVIQRIVYVHRVTHGPPRPEIARRPAPALLDPAVKGRSGD